MRNYLQELVLPQARFESKEVISAGWRSSNDILLDAFSKIMEAEIKGKISECELGPDSVEEIYSKLAIAGYNVEPLPFEDEYILSQNLNIENVPEKFSGQNTYKYEYERRITNNFFDWKLEQFIRSEFSYPDTPNNFNENERLFVIETGTAKYYETEDAFYSFNSRKEDMKKLAALYPYNLLTDLFDKLPIVGVPLVKGYEELLERNVEKLLNSIPKRIATVLRLKYKYGIFGEKLLEVLSLPKWESLQWAAEQYNKVSNFTETFNEEDINNLERVLSYIVELYDHNEEVEVTYITELTEELENLMIESKCSSFSNLRKNMEEKGELLPSDIGFWDVKLAMNIKGDICSTIPLDLMDEKLITKVMPELERRNIKQVIFDYFNHILLVSCDGEDVVYTLQSTKETPISCLKLSNCITGMFYENYSKMVILNENPWFIREFCLACSAAIEDTRASAKYKLLAGNIEDQIMMSCKGNGILWATLENLGLSQRTASCLDDYGVRNIRSLVRIRDNEYGMIRNMTEDSFNEIRTKLIELGERALFIL